MKEKGITILYSVDTTPVHRIKSFLWNDQKAFHLLRITAGEAQSTYALLKTKKQPDYSNYA